MDSSDEILGNSWICQSKTIGLQKKIIGIPKKLMDLSAEILGIPGKFVDLSEQVHKIVRKKSKEFLKN